MKRRAIKKTPNNNAYLIIKYLLEPVIKVETKTKIKGKILFRTGKWYKLRAFLDLD